MGDKGTRNGGMNLLGEHVGVTLCQLAIDSSCFLMRMRAITLAAETLCDAGGIGTNGPGLLHEIALAILKAIRTSVKLCFDEVMSTSERKDLGVPPVLAGSGPLNTDNTPLRYHNFREDLKIGEEFAEKGAVLV